MSVLIQAKELKNEGSISVPRSKSIANRLLMIQALEGSELMVPDKHDARDVHLFYNAIKSEEDVKDLLDAGTAMRFSTAYFSAANGSFTLKGTDRMHHRPIGPLVDALRQWGASIKYLENDGFPPLKIEGKGPVEGGLTEVDADVSSQYLSALLMLAPINLKPSSIRLKGGLISRPYVELTLDVMKQCGVEVQLEGDTYIVPNKGYQIRENIEVEKDWSSASFFYALCSILPGLNLDITALKFKSVQGDKQTVELFDILGVQCIERTHALSIHSNGNPTSDPIHIDFSDIPDLFLPFVASCAGLGLDAHFEGVKNLRFKESDRLEAAQKNLAAMNCQLEIEEDKAVLKCRDLPRKVHFESFDDHRVAMAFVILAPLFDELEIDDLTCISKSFPTFIEQLQSLNFQFKNQSL